MSAISHMKNRTHEQQFRLKSFCETPALTITSDNTSTMIVAQKLDEYTLILAGMFEESTREPYGYRGGHTPHIHV